MNDTLRNLNTNECLILHGDSRKKLLDLTYCVDLIVTSPPYANARVKHYDSIHPDNFSKWFSSFHQVFWNALKPDGNLVINIKDKVVDGKRHRFVWETIAKLSDLGWFCIEDYIWCKTNPMPGYWPTRLRDGWEYCFHLAKCKRPFINQDAVRIPMGEWAKTRLQNLGKNDLKRSNSANQSGFGRDISQWVGKDTVLPTNVLNIPLVGKNKGHPAVFPIELPSFFIKLLSRSNSLIVDPFGGSGSTGIAAALLDRKCLLIDNNRSYCELAYARILKETSLSPNQILLEEKHSHQPTINLDHSLAEHIL